MKRLIDLTCDEAREHFLKGSSYFSADLPSYISFEPILRAVAAAINGASYHDFKATNPNDRPNVNYSFIANKDGRFAWRPYELMHPSIYVSLVNVICDEANWQALTARFKQFEGGVVHCCSAPVMSVDHQSDAATQVRSWWQDVEQRSIEYSLEFSHLLHTDVTDCYGSLYTHSIPWALHGFDRAKTGKGQDNLLGDKIDSHIQAGRYGQTNGISQGSVLMDFVAELVLGFVDESINSKLKETQDVRILRYRDDYRIFANSDERAESILKIVSDELRLVGMRLGVSKTYSSRNVVEGSVKPDKLAGIELQDLGEANARTIQKQLLRLHSFGQRFPNSGTLRRLVGEFHANIVSKDADAPPDLEVLVAIATDIAYVSPSTFPAVAGILSHLISLASRDEKVSLWERVRSKMGRVPYNGYLEMWLQRVTRPTAVGVTFVSNEPICRIVDGDTPTLWESEWISSKALKAALDVKAMVVGNVAEVAEVVQSDEIQLFKQSAWAY
ncbi:MAG: RNA-directed DNA polymerase [Fimbriimonadaceae bacterium]|nr:RNA-directed DNA polymerase [Fimbriimonadaceae bacterium]RIK01022.1 MAG: hypothetical protein DCC46_02715 [Armatimonadota bacterium]